MNFWESMFLLHVVLWLNNSQFICLYHIKDTYFYLCKLRYKGLSFPPNSGSFNNKFQHTRTNLFWKMFLGSLHIYLLSILVAYVYALLLIKCCHDYTMLYFMGWQQQKSFFLTFKAQSAVIPMLCTQCWDFIRSWLHFLYQIKAHVNICTCLVQS